MPGAVTEDGRKGEGMKQTLPRGFLWGFVVALLLLSVVLMLCLSEIVRGAACHWVVDPVWLVVRSVRRFFAG